MNQDTTAPGEIKQGVSRNSPLRAFFGGYARELANIEAIALVGYGLSGISSGGSFLCSHVAFSPFEAMWLASRWCATTGAARWIGLGGPSLGRIGIFRAPRDGRPMLCSHVTIDGEMLEPPEFVFARSQARQSAGENRKGEAIEYVVGGLLAVPTELQEPMTFRCYAAGSHCNLPVALVSVG
jgi:hypothetical protein